MKYLLILSLILTFNFSFADEYHYRNNLIGEKASGMGGAYIAISDDPSGMFYNPAGILFSYEDYFSLSANGLSNAKKVYKDVLGAGEDYTYNSSDWVANFFGFTQFIGRHKWGFALIVPNSDFYDQDDNPTGLSSAVGQANSLKRKFFRKNSTYYFGPAFATEIFKDLTIGISLFGVYYKDQVIDNQFVKFNADNVSRERFYFQETSWNQESYGALLKIGAQYMPMPKISIGGTLAFGQTMTTQRKTKLTSSAKDNNEKPADIQYDLLQDIVELSQNAEPKLNLPMELGVGVAYFPNKKMTLAADMIYHGVDNVFKDFDVVSVINFSVGGEYYFKDSLVFRGGLFTNNANTPTLSSSEMNQRDHVDLMGTTLSVSFVKPGSSFTIGTVYSQGQGEGQAIGGSTIIHDVEMKTNTLFITGSYQL